MEKTVPVSVQLIQVLLNYLATKPYNEVAQLIGAFANVGRPVQETVTEPAPKQDKNAKKIAELKALQKKVETED